MKHEDFVSLTEVGLPTKILSNNFIYNKQIVEDNNGSIILGHNSHVKEWQLKINIEDSSIFCSGKGNLTDEVYWFYNSSITALLLSLLTYDFYLRKLIINKYLGEYPTSHGKYANLLTELLANIDNVATEKGVWFSLIDEMKLGVI